MRVSDVGRTASGRRERKERASAMRSSLVATTGLRLVRGPSVRRDAARRRWTVVGAIASLALASGLIGYLTTPAGVNEPRTGPFSYFPSQ